MQSAAACCILAHFVLEKIQVSHFPTTLSSAVVKPRIHVFKRKRSMEIVFARKCDFWEIIKCAVN